VCYWLLKHALVWLVVSFFCFPFIGSGFRLGDFSEIVWLANYMHDKQRAQLTLRYQRKFFASLWCKYMRDAMAVESLRKTIASCSHADEYHQNCHREVGTVMPPSVFIRTTLAGIAC
jgi:hypothetical protein